MPDLCLITLWDTLVTETHQLVDEEPVLASFLNATILSHKDMASAMSFHLASKLASDIVPALQLREVFDEAYAGDETIVESARCDIVATYERDSACRNFTTPFLYFKGFHALEAYRVAHWLWQQGRKSLALVLQNRISTVFGVDIHPAAIIGQGVMLDHATGIVIGETAKVGNCVSIMQSVTLGGTGKESGDRHPKIGRGVLLGPGAKVLGNISIGECSKIAAASVVVKAVPPHSIAAGVPATIVGQTDSADPATEMDQGLSGCCL